MSFNVKRTTKAAVVAETTEGVPVQPSGATDGFVALQEAFEMNNDVDVIENLELQGSIGKAAPVQGLENPTASLDHYLRHSGVEGTEPNYSEILESLLGVAADANGTERTTAAASTTSIVKLAAGGTDFARGKAILLKDGTNGYSVRNVASVSSDDLTLAQNLDTAPASGVTCGKNVLFGMADAGLPMTIWNYLGNGTAVQMLSGAKGDSGTFTFTAGDAINASYSFVGTRYYFNPLEVDATNKYIDIVDDGGTIVVTLSEKTYRDPDELATEITTKATAASVGSGDDAIAATYSSSTGKYSFSTDGSTLSFLWKTGVHGSDNTDDHVGTLIGFDDAADDTGSTSYEADSALSFAAPYTPTIDSEDFLVAKDNELIIGSSSQVACVNAQTVTVNFNKESINELDICAASGKAGTSFSGRDVTIDVVAYLQQYDITKWLNFRDNDTVVFTYNCGRKSSDNWTAGSVVNLHCPTAKISTITVGDVDGLLTLNMTLTAFVSSSQDEFYLNML